MHLGNIVNTMSNSMCCVKCVTLNLKALMEDFLDFCSAHKDKMGKDDNTIIFYSKVDCL